MDSEARAVIWQWVIGAGVIALAAAAATYTPSMPEGPSPSEPSNAPAPRLSQLLPPTGQGPVEATLGITPHPARQ